jgi:hypothetical protein
MNERNKSHLSSLVALMAVATVLAVLAGGCKPAENAPAATEVAG